MPFRTLEPTNPRSYVLFSWLYHKMEDNFFYSEHTSVLLISELKHLIKMDSETKKLKSVFNLKILNILFVSFKLILNWKFNFLCQRRISVKETPTKLSSKSQSKNFNRHRIMSRAIEIFFSLIKPKNIFKNVYFSKVQQKKLQFE